ncbi:MAG: UvrD-helicase domain-containing protein [Lentisphaerae bacterium]|nr:UvrD-helicase domain-containing protein [Lentisphaerota bacterium]
MTDYTQILNEEQRAAVMAGEGPLLVLAAAGTGKTHTLVYRVAYLIENGVNPGSILLLTFTNRAAREMLERARIVCGDAVGSVWSGTFHHICNRMLRRFSERVGYPNDFSILDRDDSRSLIDQCVKNLNLTSKDFPKKDVLASLFSNAASRNVPVEEVIEASLDSLKVDIDDIVRVAEAYAARKVEVRAMDFDDLLLNGLRLISEHKEIREHYQERFAHILVDEYQDTNGPQSQLVDLLAAKCRNIMAVGDDFQCIYSWRGADFRNIMEFPKRYPDCTVIKLEQNYRSVPEILSVANTCIAGNPEQFQKVLRATRPARVKPRTMYLRDGQEQAEAVIRMINRYHADGCPYSDMAILYRAHFHSIELQVALGRMGIPHRITSGLGVFEQAHVKDVLAFLRVCTQPGDSISFSRLLGMLRGVGPKTVEAWWSKLGGHFDSANPAHRAALINLMRPAIAEAWRPVNDALTAYHEENLGTNGGAAIRLFYETFYEVYMARTYESPERRAEDIQELESQISKASNVVAFLSDVALLTNVDHQYARRERGEDDDAVQLSTVHQAKGLEWPVVFVIWAVEGMFPSGRTMEESGGDAEERRLFYVAVTRARDELVLLAPELRTTRDGGYFFCKPSRFIKELPRHLITETYGRRF